MDFAVNVCYLLGDGAREQDWPARASRIERSWARAMIESERAKSSFIIKLEWAGAREEWHRSERGAGMGGIELERARTDENEWYCTICTLFYTAQLYSIPLEHFEPEPGLVCHRSHLSKSIVNTAQSYRVYGQNWAPNEPNWKSSRLALGQIGSNGFSLGVMPDRRPNVSSGNTARAGTHNDHLDPRRVRRYSAGARRLLGCFFRKHDLK